MPARAWGFKSPLAHVVACRETSETDRCLSRRHATGAGRRRHSVGRHEPHDRRPQRRHAVRRRAARPPKRTVRVDVACDSRPVLLVPADLGVHRLVRLHRHRATGGRAGRWAITAPGWHGRLPAGITRLTSPTPQLLLLGRFRATDATDVRRVLRAREPSRPATALGDHGCRAAARATCVRCARRPAANGRRRGHPVLRRARRRARDQPAHRPPGATNPGELCQARHRRGPASEHAVARVCVPALAAGVRLGEARIGAGRGRPPRRATVGRSTCTSARTVTTRCCARPSRDTGWGANVPAEAVYASLGS